MTFSLLTALPLLAAAGPVTVEMAHSLGTVYDSCTLLRLKLNTKETFWLLILYPL